MNDKRTPARPRLLDQVRDRLRVLHYSYRTEQAYIDWIKRYVLFHGKRHPSEMGAPHVEAFLTHLAVKSRVSASTQNQAKSALLFLYKQVLGIELDWLQDVPHARRSVHLPVVLTPEETRAARPAERNALADGKPDLRFGFTPDGGASPEGEGRGLRAQGDHRSRRQGRQGPRHHAARAFARTAAAPSGKGQGPAC